MELTRLYRELEADLEYPIDLETVIERIGDTEIEAPDRMDSETVAGILGPLGQDTYNSPVELADAIIGNVGDEYVGRKFYDDRGGNLPGERPALVDDIDVSF